MKKKLLALMLLLTSFTLWAEEPTLNPTSEELKAAGQRIFQNETGGKKELLVHWNVGEDFPSLGIGHFIWFKRGANEPFTESFPGLVKAYLDNGYKSSDLPKIMTATPYAPWNSREEFLAKKEANDKDILALIDFLYEHQEVQVRYIMDRLVAALPLMMEASSRPDHVKQQFYRVAQSPGGFYPLIDYVNFKGEGINPNERYKNVGWGLLQVLETMKGTKTGKPALKDFSSAAAKVLNQRIKLSPIERGEDRWREGWMARVRTYAQ
ncbi:hypothetical protein [Entomospira culicis]|uniref:Uncharacterized protein n=1 Tax=Entomospira culicis TaxID=2719989 RepID=A0A968GDW1_9SPIO|nr:hypothetical protein [Entomospira culicis]NIZ18538.1 hypothetical protein [Entomospira culicis]NIZ68754.1 hypothetical protein [Entomospira culicis]WDI37350.1 hypothetical protein PVA46_00750 [Entomospira culicis]WDI38979.1 hypothetical protein PVA47_00760 [Entomospira culicis]